MSDFVGAGFYRIESILDRGVQGVQQTNNPIWLRQIELFGPIRASDWIVWSKLLRLFELFELFELV
jgi:hypothetical protein